MTSQPTPDFEPDHPETPPEQHVDYSGFPKGRCDRCLLPIDDHVLDMKGRMQACPARAK